MFLFNSFFFFFFVTRFHFCWKAGMSEEVDLYIFGLNPPYESGLSSTSQGPQCPAFGQPPGFPD